MKGRRRLEMLLSRMKDIDDPDPSLEQYRTPSDLVVDILLRALSDGDIKGRSVMELGCGFAPFAIGAMILGASSVHAVDIDPRAIEKARENLALISRSALPDHGNRIELICADVSEEEPYLPMVDTILMNPPFGSQKKNADRPFIKAAALHAGSIYSIHQGSTLPFLKKEWERFGGEIVHSEFRSITIPHRFHFHNRESLSARVVVIKVRVAE